MKPYFLFLGCFLAILPLLKAENLDLIVPSNVRQEVIGEAEQYSQYPQNLEVLDCSAVHFKFLAKDALVTTAAEEPVLDTKTLTPDAILNEASAFLNPRGVMMRKGMYYIVLPKKPVPVGTRLKISLNGVIYIIVVSEVSPKAYTLQYQDVKKTFGFNSSQKTASSEKALKK